jgi:ribonuclease P protein component
MANAQFQPLYRVRCTGDFQRAYRLRCSATDGRIVVFGHANGLTHPRLGISASRRLGGAVVRNRWKRLLRESFRLNRDRLPPGIDLIVVPKPNVEPALASLIESLPQLAARVAKKLAL